MAKSSANAKQICKVFKSTFGEVKLDTFSMDIDECLSRHTDFFEDLWNKDKYVAQSVLEGGLKLAFPGLDKLVCRQIAKSLKGLLSTLHFKKHRLTSGQVCFQTVLIISHFA